MGYFLPITNTSFQYMQYADREIGTNYNPFPVGNIDAIRKLAPVQKGQDLAEPDTHRQLATMANKQKSYKRKVNHEVLKKTFAEVTGKGHYFSVSI
ncbi:hypothetical protein [Mesobacillus zeae]|uniref:Uncharacterized protein n=1 Tax=Mesobacillus zeae TaxID=1917180 RepID=A0A398AWC5_9BACI|nr:hypothetical protein [Mesobacillus zeae]RID82029.1 hypothetical protein D1970_20130 [Mesobacillus zeae]